MIMQNERRSLPGRRLRPGPMPPWNPLAGQLLPPADRRCPRWPADPCRGPWPEQAGRRPRAV